MWKFIKNIGTEQQIYMGILLLAILLAIFWPRDRNLFEVSLQTKLGNLGGKISVEGFKDKKPTFVFFYAPWCGHCKKMMSEWDKLISFYSDKEYKDVELSKVNCDENPDLAKQHNVDGYPTLKFLPYGISDPRGAIVYDGPRNATEFQTFIMEHK